MRLALYLLLVSHVVTSSQSQNGPLIHCKVISESCVGLIWWSCVSHMFVTGIVGYNCYNSFPVTPCYFHICLSNCRAVIATAWRTSIISTRIIWPGPFTDNAATLLILLSCLVCYRCRCQPRNVCVSAIEVRCLSQCRRMYMHVQAVTNSPDQQLSAMEEHPHCP